MIETEKINDFFGILGIEVFRKHGLSLEIDMETRIFDDFSLEIDVGIYLVNHKTSYDLLLTSDVIELQANVKAIEDLKIEKINQNRG